MIKTFGGIDETHEYWWILSSDNFGFKAKLISFNLKLLLVAPLFKRCHMFLTPDPIPDTTLQGFVPLLGIFYLLGKFVNHYTMELPNMHIYVC